MSQCPGPCNSPRRRHCAGRSRTPIQGEPVWCRRCQALVRQRLAELDDLAAKVSGALDQRRRRTGEEKVSGTRSRPSPSSAVDDLDELLHTLLGWEDAYREARAFGSRPRRGRYAPTLAGCVAWLSAHLDGLLTFDGAKDFGREVLRLHRRLRSRTPSSLPSHRTTRPCPACDLLALKHDPTAEEIRCRACGWTASATEYATQQRKAS